MGRKITDGLAVDCVAPASTHIIKGEMYRIDKWTGIAMDDITATEVARNVALEASFALWRVLVPAGKAGTRGGFLYWSAGTGFKVGATDLLDAPATAGDAPVAKVESVRNSNGYATVRVLNTGPAA